MAIKRISANLLGGNAVLAANIAGGAISAADIADNSITAAKLSASTSPTFGGLTVAGTVTMDGLTVDGNGVFSATSGDTLTLKKATGASFVFNNTTAATASITAINNADGMDFRVGSAQAIKARLDSSGNLIMTAGGTIRAGGVNDLILDAGESGTPDIYLQSGGATKVKIEGSNGFVGIGTSNPQMKLHVGSGTQSTAALAGIGIANGGSAYSFYSASDGTKQYIAGIDHTITYTKAGSLSNHSHSIITNNTNAIFIDTSQNVGIGTDNPTGAKLHVTGGVKATDLIAHDSTGINLQTDEGTKRLVVTDAGNITFPGQTTTFNTPGFTHHTNNYLYLRGGSSGLVLADDSNANTIQIIDGVAGYINFETSNGTSRMRLDSSGNLGVGITTIEQLGSDSVYPRIQSYSSATSGHFCGLMIGRPNSPGLESSIAFTVGGIMVGKIQHDYVAANHNDMSFHLRGASGDTDLEVARYWAGSGSEYAYLIGVTDATLSGTDSGFVFKSDGNSSFVTGTGIMYMRRTSSNGTHIKFRSTTNATVGQIDSDGSNTSYVTSSDYRLKENISYDFDALTRVQQLKPARFNFIENPDITQDGFIAHEVQDIVPIAVSGIKDAVDEEGNIEPQGVDHSKLVPLLTKAIQEQQTIIDDLKSRLDEAGL